MTDAAKEPATEAPDVARATTQPDPPVAAAQGEPGAALTEDERQGILEDEKLAGMVSADATEPDLDPDHFSFGKPPTGFAPQ